MDFKIAREKVKYWHLLSKIDLTVVVNGTVVSDPKQRLNSFTMVSDANISRAVGAPQIWMSVSSWHHP